jgi:hypothetical protein
MKLNDYNKILINFTKRSMPPKASTRKSAPKEDKKEDKTVTPEPEIKTRTRGRQLDKSTPKDEEPTKKIKTDDVDNSDLKKSKTEPKRTRSDLSASKKPDDSPVKPAAK